MSLAVKRIRKNKGSCGSDGMGVDELSDFLKFRGLEFTQSVMKEKYKPNPVMRVEIPKPDGGVRLLGIPTVIDRMLQQSKESCAVLLNFWKIS